MDSSQLGRFLQPLSINTDQLSFPQSLWISSPLSSGYGTEPPSPFTPTDSAWPTSIWDDTKEKKDVETNCCSLVNTSWRNTTEDQQPEKAASSSSAMATPGPLSTLHFEPVSSSTWRDYSSPIVKRAIVTMDVEQIGPEDQRHHQLDGDKTKHFIRKPWGIATNTRTEQIYVADRQFHVILVFGPDGEYQHKIGGHGSAEGLLDRPSGLAYDATHDRILVVDKDNHRIQAFCATTGDFLFAFGSKGRQRGQFNYPWGIAVSQDGERIAVADARNQRVQLFSSDGTFIRFYLIPSTEYYRNRLSSSYPRGIVFDKTGNFLFVTDFNQHLIVRLNIATAQLETIVGNRLLKRPSGIAVDHFGNLLVADTRNNVIRVFRPDGRPVGVLKQVGKSLFDLPLGVCLMTDGHIATLDLNGRVQIF